MLDGSRSAQSNAAVIPSSFAASSSRTAPPSGRRHRIRGSHAAEVFLDIFNVTNRANFDNPSGDERVTSTFLVLTNLRGGGGFPRQAQFGVRYTF